MKKLFRISGWIITLFLTISVGTVLYYKWMPVQITPLMIIRATEKGDWGWHHQWVSVSEISPHMSHAVIASEDQRFLQHNGFDFAEIKKAHDDAEDGKKLRGASTISQQTAKNVFLWPGRSWIRKGLEAYFTVLIEWIWGKERIMEVYLNSIEMGDNIYGVRAVAEYSFGKSAIELSRSEAALIAATLPNPLKYSSKTPNKYIRKRQRQILRQMKNIGAIKFNP